MSRLRSLLPQGEKRHASEVALDARRVSLCEKIFGLQEVADMTEEDRRVKQRVTVLMYHAVTEAGDRMAGADPHYSVSRTQFLSQLDQIKIAGLRATSLAALLDSTPGNDQLGLTFDDGHSSVFWTTLRTKVLLGLIFGVVFFVLLFVNLVIVRRMKPETRILTPDQEIVERIRQQFEPMLRWLLPLACGLLALFVAIGVSRQWQTFLLWRSSTGIASSGSGTSSVVRQKRSKKFCRGH